MTNFVSRETLLAAVFLCNMPFCAALSISELAVFKVAFASSVLLFAVSVSIFLNSVLIVFLVDLFFRVRFLVCLTRLMADWLLLGADFAGKVLPPLSYRLQLN